MRQYRGKTKDGKEVRGHLDWEKDEYGNVKWTIHTGLEGGFEEYYEVLPETVGQSTGEIINKKEVFDGDRVRTQSGDIWQVTFENGAYKAVNRSGDMTCLGYLNLAEIIHDKEQE